MVLEEHSVVRILDEENYKQLTPVNNGGLL